MSDRSAQRSIELLTELVRIPSVNPMLVPGATGEHEIASVIANRLSQMPGISVEIIDDDAGRPNVVASAGNGPGRTLMLNGHTDTVGIAGMKQPFEPYIEDNRLHGRGAIDMKASLAGMIVVLEEIARDPTFPGTVVGTFVADEEYASTGTQAICREIGRWAPDGAIVTEPQGLQIGIAHKGFVWAEINTHGFAAHGSQHQLGVDAIAHMGRVLEGLERLNARLGTVDPHPLVGLPSVHASLIQGGQELSSYPESTRLEIERRTVPGETESQIRAEIQHIIEHLSAQDEQFSADYSIMLVRDPFEVNEEEPVVKALQRATQATTGVPATLSGSMGWMDSSILDQAGVPTAIFGPTGEGAHGLDEWVDLDSLATFISVLQKACYEFCADD